VLSRRHVAAAATAAAARGGGSLGRRASAQALRQDDLLRFEPLGGSPVRQLVMHHIERLKSVRLPESHDLRVVGL